MDVLLHDFDAVAVVQKRNGHFLLLAERNMLEHLEILSLSYCAVDLRVVLLGMSVLDRGEETIRVVFVFDLPVALGMNHVMKCLDDELNFKKGEFLMQGSQNILDLLFLGHSFGVLNFLGAIVVDFLKDVFLVGLDDIFDSVEIDPTNPIQHHFPLPPNNSTIRFFSISSLFIQSGTGKFMAIVIVFIFSASMFISL